MNFLMSVEKGDYGTSIIETKGFTETVLFGGKMLLIGMLAVFAVLCLIWLALAVFNKIFSTAENKSENNAPVSVESITPVSSNTDEEIIVAIAAAIAMAESEDSGAKFRVVSFKKI